MPLQFMLTAEAVARLHNGARQGIDNPLLTSPVGQIVGRMNAIRPAADIVADMVAECQATLAKMGALS